MKKIINLIKENKIFILIMIAIVIVFNIKLPYYVSAPGGVIDITDRIKVDNSYKPDGTLNLLYVTEYEGKLASVLFSYLFNDWDLEKNEERQISNENPEEIYERNRLMLDNSIQNATFVAYKYANKEIEVTDKKNIVLAVTNQNGLEIGDIILKADGVEIDNVANLKEIIKTKNVGESIDILIERDGKEKTVTSKILEDKLIGVVIITDYEYKLNPTIDIKFKARESGSSGGLMLALTIYNAISGEDIIKGRNIAGTGTIDINGDVGEIDGIKYKIMGAVKNNMDLILVPSNNYKEALKVKKEKNYDIELVEIKTFEEAINYLKNN